MPQRNVTKIRNFIISLIIINLRNNHKFAIKIKSQVAIPFTEILKIKYWQDVKQI